MKMATRKLLGIPLDWAVAIAKGIPAEELKLPAWKGLSIFRYLRDEDGELNGRYMTGPDLLFSTKWEAGGLIIERERIGVVFVVEDETGAGRWSASNLFTNVYGVAGQTPLVAAMRCYVVSKFGDFVDIPDELV